MEEAGGALRDRLWPTIEPLLKCVNACLVAHLPNVLLSTGSEKRDSALFASQWILFLLHELIELWVRDMLGGRVRDFNVLHCDLILVIVRHLDGGIVIAWLIALALLVVHHNGLVLSRACIAQGKCEATVACWIAYQHIFAVACAGNAQWHLDIGTADLVGDRKHLLRQVIPGFHTGNLCTGKVNRGRRRRKHSLQPLERGASRLRPKVTYQLVLELLRQAAE